MLTNSEIMPDILNPNIHFFFEGSKPPLKNRQKLKSFISSIFIAEKRKLESLNFIFTNDRTIHGINKRYLDHDFYTDIITFQLSNGTNPVIAEVYISSDRVKENAAIHNTSFREELHRVIFHGVLHLCGYRDKSSPQTKKMRARENTYLLKYFG